MGIRAEVQGGHLGGGEKGRDPKKVRNQPCGSRAVMEAVASSDQPRPHSARVNASNPHTETLGGIVPISQMVPRLAAAKWQGWHQTSALWLHHLCAHCSVPHPSGERGISDETDGTCKGPGARMCLVSLRRSHRAIVAGAQ